jgi:hypothetical protein
VISTERGVFASDYDRPYLADGQGQVLRIPAGGNGFSPVAKIGGQPAGFTSEGDELFAALGDGSVKRSTDGGATWTLRAAP